MPKITLTQNFVQQASCSTGKPKTDYYDDKITGLLLKVLKSGRKTYYLRYKNNRSKMIEHKLADATILKVSEARKLAQETLAMLAMGQVKWTPKFGQVPKL